MSDHPLLHRIEGKIEEIEDKIEEIGDALKRRVGNLIHGDEEEVRPVEAQAPPAAFAAPQFVMPDQSVVTSKPKDNTAFGKTKPLKRTNRQTQKATGKPKVASVPTKSLRAEPHGEQPVRVGEGRVKVAPRGRR